MGLRLQAGPAIAGPGVLRCLTLRKSPPPSHPCRPACPFPPQPVWRCGVGDAPGAVCWPPAGDLCAAVHHNYLGQPAARAVRCLSRRPAARRGAAASLCIHRRGAPPAHQPPTPPPHAPLPPPLLRPAGSRPSRLTRCGRPRCRRGASACGGSASASRARSRATRRSSRDGSPPCDEASSLACVLPAPQFSSPWVPPPPPVPISCFTVCHHASPLTLPPARVASRCFRRFAGLSSFSRAARSALLPPTHNNSPSFLNVNPAPLVEGWGPAVYHPAAAPPPHLPVPALPGEFLCL